MDTTLGYCSVEKCGHYLEKRLPHFIPPMKLIGKIKKHSEPDQNWVERISRESYTISEKKRWRKNIPLVTISSNSQGQELTTYQSFVRGQFALFLGEQNGKNCCIIVSYRFQILHIYFNLHVEIFPEVILFKLFINHSASFIK